MPYGAVGVGFLPARLWTLVCRLCSMLLLSSLTHRPCLQALPCQHAAPSVAVQAATTAPDPLSHGAGSSAALIGEASAHRTLPWAQQHALAALSDLPATRAPQAPTGMRRREGQRRCVQRLQRQRGDDVHIQDARRGLAGQPSMAVRPQQLPSWRPSRSCGARPSRRLGVQVQRHAAVAGRVPAAGRCTRSLCRVPCSSKRASLF